MNPLLKKSFPWLIAAAVCLLVGIWLVKGRSKSGPTTLATTTAVAAKIAQLPDPVAVPAAPPEPIDLTPYYDIPASTFPRQGAWIAAPIGSQTFGNVPLQIGGLVSLWGAGSAGAGMVFAEQVLGIPVNRKFETLYVYHSASYSAGEGEPIYDLVFRYADGSSATNGLRFGVHVRDWYQLPTETTTGPTDPNSKVVWRGTYLNGAKLQSLRFFMTALANPKPALEMTTIDLYSRKSRAATRVIALTTGPAGLLKVDPKVDHPDPVPEPQETTILFTALDAATAKPIAGMQAKVTTISGQRSTPAGVFDTDDQGQATIIVPPIQLSSLAISTLADGYPPYTVRWETQNGAKIPTNFIFKVDRGITVGGIARDEEGAPIEGLKVAIALNRLPPSRTDGALLNLNGHLEFTDSEGRWSCSHIPKDLADKLTLHATHPDFLATTFTSDPAERPGVGSLVAVADLTASKAVLAIKSGVNIKVVVIGPDGKPADSVPVLLGERSGRTKRSEYTDADGKASFRNSAEGPNFVTVQADGLAPELQTFEVQRGMPEIKIQLAKGKQLKGRLLDPEGAPIADTAVLAETWRNRRTLEWQTITDAEGRFQWESAPADAVTFTATVAGFLPLHSAITADGAEHPLKLRKSAFLTGKVTDADTGKPVVNLTVTLGREYGPNSIQWDPIGGRGRGGSLNNPGGPGTYRVELGQDQNMIQNGFPGGLVSTASAQPYRLKVQAPGYLPQISKTIRSDGDETAFDFKLVKGMGPNGVVLGVDGQPLADVQLVLSTRNGLTMMGKRALRNNGLAMVRTDATGHFSIPADPEAVKLIAVHANGFAEVPVENVSSNRPVQLQAWGRIAGKFKAGTNFVASAKLSLNNSGAGGLYFDSNQFQTLTDADGNFVIEDVPPGERTIAQMIPLGANSSLISNPTTVMVAPGSTTQLTIGGTGRPIVGQAKLSDPNTPVNWSISRLSAITRQPAQTHPFQSAADAIEWQNSAEFQAFMKSRRSFSAVMNTNGTFRLEDIPAGVYDLSISAMGDPAPDANTQDPRFISGIRGVMLGNTSKAITIPEMPGGRSDEPLDVGVLEITPRISQPRTVAPVAGRN